MSYEDDINFMDSIEACRTCGIFFLTSSSFLRQIFAPAIDNPEMMHIRMELSSWKIEINENDGFPQYICTGCIYEFQKILKFRRSCIDIQEQLRHFYNVRQQNQIQIKTELPDEVEEIDCDFIYVDDLSDSEYDGTTVPFNVPHLPIKEERIEEAAVPTDLPVTYIDTANTNIRCQDFESPSQNINSEPEATRLPAAVIKIVTDADGKSCFTNEHHDDNSNSASAVVIKCELCNCTSVNKQQHKLHMKRVHDIKDIECHICGKTFKNSSATRLKFHLKWHKLNKHMKCVQCGFYCSSREILKEHTREMHSKVNCPICGKFVVSKRMKYHMTTHGEDGSVFECLQCAQVFSSSAAKDEHIIHVHSNDESSVKKNGLGKQEDAMFEEESNFISIEIVCALCDHKFQNQNELELHVREQHQEEKSSSNKSCEQYSFDYAENNEVASEKSSSMESNLLDEIYCLNCHKRFFERNALAQHVQQCQLTLHDNNVVDTISNAYTENQSVDVVNYQYQLQRSQEEYELNSHDNSDALQGLTIATSGDSIDESISEINLFNQLHNFGCAQCADTFKNVEQLRAHHEAIHSKKPNFSCHICEKTFELKFSLNRHMKKHNV